MIVKIIVHKMIHLTPQPSEPMQTRRTNMLELLFVLVLASNEMNTNVFLNLAHNPLLVQLLKMYHT